MNWFPAENGAPSGMLDFTFDNPADKAMYLAGESIEDRVKNLYGSQTQMCRLAMPMARYRAWIIDYFEQFPALPIWMAHGVRDPHRVTPKQAEMIQRTVMDVFSARPRLRDVMRRWGIPKAMRKLHAKALLPRHADLLRVLCEMNPSMLSQAIPSHPKKQRVWLDVLAGCVDRMFETRMWPWIVRELGTHNRSELLDMVDFYTRGAHQLGGHFDLKWTWGQAAAARDRWHQQLARQKASVHGVPPDEVICRNPMPDEVDIGEYRFTALRTPEAIHLEGAAMHHCVASYTPKVIRGEAHIVSCTRKGKRVATIEMGLHMGAVQTRGPCNSMWFPAGFREAAQKYDSRYRKLIRQD